MMRGHDSGTAVTFLMIGLGIGAVLALVLAPEHRLSRSSRSRSFTNPAPARRERIRA